MTQFIVLAHVETPPDRIPEIESELKALATATRNEPGCLTYQICRDIEASEGKWLIYEIWQSESHWRTHLETPHLLHFKKVVLPPTGELRAVKLKPRTV
ncbi:MAG: putative quinol monooxygenase [Paracoccaceae bacterium]